MPVSLSTNPSNDAATLAEYQRQLALLSAVLEGTTLAVLGDEYCQKLKDCKQELEAKIKEVRQGPPESSNQLQQASELSSTLHETTLKEAETPAKDTPSEHSAWELDPSVINNVHQICGWDENGKRLFEEGNGNAGIAGEQPFNGSRQAVQVRYLGKAKI